jgi:hypothetical protein
MDSDLDMLLNKLTLNELHQLTLVLDTDCNGSKNEIHNYIQLKYNFDDVYRQIIDLTKYKYFIKCYNKTVIYYQNTNSSQNMLSIFHNNKLLENSVIKDNYYIINDYVCPICKIEHEIYQYESIFHINDLTNDSINFSLKDSNYKLNRQYKCTDSCQIL